MEKEEGKKEEAKKEEKGGKKKEDEKKKPAEPEKRVVRYGPNDCISTYESKSGTCIMETNCDAKNITDYEFGLICIEKDGTPVRHIFGKNSFDPTETFDTLIQCNQCLGIDDFQTDVALAEDVEGLATEVKEMKDSIGALKKDVAEL